MRPSGPTSTERCAPGQAIHHLVVGIPLQQQHLTHPPLEQTPEGFVVYWNGLPVAKMKNRFYSDKHLLITGTFAHSLASGSCCHLANLAVVLTALCCVAFWLCREPALEP